jgi:hypothetical protein
MEPTKHCLKKWEGGKGLREYKEGGELGQSTLCNYGIVTAKNPRTINVHLLKSKTKFKKNTFQLH